MADEKVTALTAITNPSSNDLLYIVDDPDGAPLSRKVDVRYVIGSGDTGSNLIKNSPGQIVTDGAEPQWWDDSGSATMTDEDAAGEAIPDKTERVFKVVTVADNHYGYQTLTFADEELLDAGATVISLGCWAYCGSANKASVAIYGTNLGLQESSQVGAAAWEWVTVENITLNAADTAIEIRLYVDTGTAYFTMPMVNLGSKVLPWRPRGTRYVPKANVSQVNLNPTGDVAWSDTDCTANTDPLAIAVQTYMYAWEPNGTAGSYADVGHSDHITGSDNNIVETTVHVVNIGPTTSATMAFCDDGQLIRYRVQEQDADNDMVIDMIITGYWMWA